MYFILSLLEKKTPTNIILQSVKKTGLTGLREKSTDALLWVLDTESAGVGAGWAKHLQHCVSWVNSSGERGVYREGPAAS